MNEMLSFKLILPHNIGTKTIVMFKWLLLFMHIYYIYSIHNLQKMALHYLGATISSFFYSNIKTKCRIYVTIILGHPGEIGPMGIKGHEGEKGDKCERGDRGPEGQKGDMVI